MMNSYEAFVARLERQNQFEIRYDPDAMAAAVRHDGLRGRLAHRTVIVAGTNGKGSTASYLHALCHQAGLRVGLYTSPHLVSFRERIRINGEAITQEDVVRYGADLFEEYGDESHAAPIRTLSYFELTTLLAFRYFERREQLDVCILEVGLGGRLDATNVVDADAACFGSISLEHQAWLGSTLGEIAREKAAVARAGRPAFLHQENAGFNELVTALQEQGPDLRVVASGDPHLVGEEAGAAGAVRQRNREVASTAFGWLQKELDLDESAVCRARESAADVVRWPGRQEVLHVDDRRYFVDGAHNVEATRALSEWLSQSRGNGAQLPVIYGVSGDRSLVDVFKPIRDFASHCAVVCLQDFSESWANAAQMAMAESFPDLPVSIHRDIRSALSSHPNEGDCIVCGSLYLVGDLYRALGYGEHRLPAILQPSARLDS